MEWGHLLPPRSMDRVIFLPEGAVPLRSMLIAGYRHRFDLVIIVVRYRSVNIWPPLREIRAATATWKVPRWLYSSDAHRRTRRIYLLGDLVSPVRITRSCSPFLLVQGLNLRFQFYS